MKTQKLVKKYIGTLEHFLEQGGYPIRIAESEAVALSFAISALTFKDGLLSRDPNKAFPDDILAEFWKLKYTEALEESNKLYNLIDSAYHKANN